MNISAKFHLMASEEMICDFFFLLTFSLSVAAMAITNQIEQIGQSSYIWSRTTQ